MEYNFKFTPEYYVTRWESARHAGHATLAKTLLNAAKRTFTEALDTKMLEALDLAWEEKLDTSEKNRYLWNEIKAASEKEAHTCAPPYPCRVCCERAMAQLIIALGVEAYNDAIEQADRLLELNEDDIVALLLRVWARMNLDFTDENEMTDHFAAAILDIQQARELTKKLPDDRIFYIKTDREDIKLVETRRDTYRSLQFTQGFIKEAEQDPDPTDSGDIDSESMPGSIFADVLKNLNPVIGLMLAGLNRYEEALPLLKEGFETARKEGDAEAIVSFGWEIVYILSSGCLSSDTFQPDAVLPYLIESLASGTDNQEMQRVMLHLLIVCLWKLDEQENFKQFDEMNTVLVLLETELEERTEQTEQMDDVALIIDIVYTIGLLHLRLERPDKAHPYFIQGLRLSEYDESLRSLLLERFIECQSGLKQQTDLEQLDHIKKVVVLVTGVHFLNEIIRSAWFTGLNEYLKIKTLELFSECMTDLEPRRIVSLLERLAEWAGSDAQRIEIFTEIFTFFRQVFDPMQDL